ncbi:MAG: DsbA family protein [Terrisporobacter sp.]
MVVFFDYNCPFCYISFKILEDLKSSFDFKCVYRPCELYPFIPPGGLFKEELMVGYDVENLYRKLRILGGRNGIEFGNLEKKYNSHMSLLLAEYAQQNNKIIDFSREIFMQYYINDVDISNLDILKNICYKVNLDYDKAIYEINNNTLENKLIENHVLEERLNVNIFPTYIINDECVLSGILTRRTFLKAFESLN